MYSWISSSVWVSNQSSIPPRDSTHPASIVGLPLTITEVGEFDNAAMPQLAVSTELPPTISAPLSSSSTASRQLVKVLPSE